MGPSPGTIFILKLQQNTFIFQILRKILPYGMYDVVAVTRSALMLNYLVKVKVIIPKRNISSIQNCVLVFNLNIYNYARVYYYYRTCNTTQHIYIYVECNNQIYFIARV